MKSIFGLIIIFTLSQFAVKAQDRTADTVIVPLAKTSRIIFTVEDKADLETLKHYNFQGLFDDIISKLQANDTTVVVDSSRSVVVTISTPDNESDDDTNDDQHWDKHRRREIGRTWQSTNIDLGTNNYLQGDQFPDQANSLYAVRPWGSWYVGINSVQRTRLGKNVFVEWALGASWYNFKFQRDDIIVSKDASDVLFTTDVRDLDHLKSKLTATFVNFSLVPVLDFGDRNRKNRVWDRGNSFRFGIGPYVGYRLSSKSKLVYEEGDKKIKEKNRDNFYMNNLRYGVRLQLGLQSTDIFINYDLNSLFAETAEPKLNAVSFGFIF